MHVSANLRRYLFKMVGSKALQHQDAHFRSRLAQRSCSTVHGIVRHGVLRILTHRGTESCGKAETQDYQLFLGLNDIGHTKTQVHHPQTNGICERFHKTILQEFHQVAFRRKLYRSIEELQADLDEWITYYNKRTPQGKMCCGRTPMQKLIVGNEARRDKITALNEQI